MQNLTLQQVFGANALQSDTTLIIQKADLSGLTATADNQGEQLLVALLLQLQQHFEGRLTDSQGRVIADEQGRAITYDNRSLYEKLNLWFWKRQFINSFEVTTFVIDVFLTPPTDVGTPLNSAKLNY